MALQNERQKAAREAKQEADDMMKEAEWSKAKIYKPPGESSNIVTSDSSNEVFGDDDTFIINEHVDPAVVAKIKKGEYIDLAKLLPMEKNCMMMADFRWLIKMGCHISCLGWRRIH